MSAGFRHPTALVESDMLGAGVRVYAYAHVMQGASVGNSTTLGDHVFVEGGAEIGARTTIKNGVLVWSGVTIEDDVFVGPGVVFTNDLRPRSPRADFAAERYAAPENWLVRTRVGRGASLGANATIVPGASIGPYAMIGAGAVVSRPTPPFALMVGAPALHVGDVCRCGARLDGDYRTAACSECGESAGERLAYLADAACPAPCV